MTIIIVGAKETHEKWLYTGLNLSKSRNMEYWLYISLFAAAVAVYAMINILMARMPNNKKMIWFAIVIIFPVIGPIIYLLRRKSIVEAS